MDYLSFMNWHSTEEESSSYADQRTDRRVSAWIWREYACIVRVYIVSDSLPVVG